MDRCSCRASHRSSSRTRTSWRPSLAPSTEILAELRGVTAGYRGSTILHDLGVTIRQGGITGIIGPNGAGKSTMLKVLLGYLTPQTGDVVLSGDVITRLAPEKRVAAGIAYIAQTRSFFANQTIDENLLLGAYLVRDRHVIEQ